MMLRIDSVSDIVAFVSTTRGLAVVVVGLLAIAIVIKVASLVVRILALLVSLATIAWLILRFRGGL
jgi:hypothetical protein